MGFEEVVKWIIRDRRANADRVLVPKRLQSGSHASFNAIGGRLVAGSWSAAAPRCGPLEDRLVLRPLVQHAHTLADGQVDARPVLGGALKDAPRLVEASPLVEVAAVDLERGVGLLIRPVFIAAVPYRDNRAWRNSPQCVALVARGASHVGALIIISASFLSSIC